MSVSLFFGLPGCGKTTLITKRAIEAVRDKRYQNVYCNVPLKVKGVTYIENSYVGKYMLCNAKILIDEATLFADSRDYKNMLKTTIEYFLLHRHYNVDIELYTQQWDGVDRKIRVITDRVYYVYKPIIIGKWFTKYYRIPYGIIIPDPKKDKSSGDKLGDIVQGYSKPDMLTRILSPMIFRPLYYKYFNSWDCKPLPQLPEECIPYGMPIADFNKEPDNDEQFIKDFRETMLQFLFEKGHTSESENEIIIKVILEDLEKDGLISTKGETVD